MSIYNIRDLSAENIKKLIKRAIEFKNGKKIELVGDVANIFIEPSTRTRLSFQKAEENLGLKIFNLNFSQSSFKKGEILEDALLNIRAMGINKFVIRSGEEKYWNKFANKFDIINGGDGTNSHPSQALLDAMTIFEHFDTLSDLQILIVGDTKHSRVYRSNMELLEKMGSTIESYSPKDENLDLKNIVAKFDVIMFLRVQHERHANKMIINDYNKKFGLNKEVLSLTKKEAIFMHPGPVNRGVEITADVLISNSKKNKVLEQVQNGVYMRMALLEWIW